MLSLLGFVACESKSNYTIFSTSLIKKPSSLSVTDGGGGGVVELSTEFSKGRGLTGSQSSDLGISEVGCWERQG